MKKKIVRVVSSDVSFLLVKGQLKFLSDNFEVIAVASAGQRLEEIPITEGVRTKSVEIRREISLINDVIALYQLYRFFRKESPFIVHSMTPKAGLLSMVAAYFARVPHRMHTFTGLIFPSKNGAFKKLLIYMDKIICYCATKIIPEGNGVKNDLINYNVTSKPMKIIANGNVNGIDSAYFDPLFFDKESKLNFRKELNISNEDFVFVFAGRLVGDKGINELIKVFCEINKEFKKTKLLLVGTFEEDRDPLKDETMQILKSNKNIINPGWVDDVRPYFAISDALTFPSYREGFPNVVMQAGAMELASIVTDINGCNEIIKNNLSGLIIPVKDETALLNAMIYILEHPEEAHAMGKKSRQHIVSNYEQQVVWNAILDEYNNL